MSTKPFEDADTEDCMQAAVARGEFTTVEQARADFLESLERGIKEADAGGGVDLVVVCAELRERYAKWPRAAE